MNKSSVDNAASTPPSNSPPGGRGGSVALGTPERGSDSKEPAPASEAGSKKPESNDGTEMIPLPMPVPVKSLSQTKTAASSATSSSAVKRNKSRSGWTEEEDAALLAALEDWNGKERESSWTTVAAMLGSSRTGKQCRDRYLNHLRDGIKKGAWTVEEESLLKDLHGVFGPRWTAFSKLLKVRTDNDIKNKWNSMVRSSKRLNRKLEEKFEDLRKNAKSSDTNPDPGSSETAGEEDNAEGPSPSEPNPCTSNAACEQGSE